MLMKAEVGEVCSRTDGQTDTRVIVRFRRTLLGQTFLSPTAGNQ